MKINGHNFKIGADPEFFVKRFGKLSSAYGLIPGTKEAPYKVPKGAVQVDGMALEFNIDPAESFEEFDSNMSQVFESIVRLVPGYEIFVEPVADFGLDFIRAQPKEARELGCSPDFDAYTGKANPRPKEDTPFRTASGHIHIGWTKEPVDINDEGHLEACRALTKALDLYLGVPSLVWDRDDRRRTLYGQAGAFRPKSYGMEYRVLSNKWINDPYCRKLVYYNTMDAIKACFDNPDVGETEFFNGMKAKDIIAKKNSQPEGARPDWEQALSYVLQYGDVKGRKFYREAA